MSDHDLALAYARRLGTIEGWLADLINLIDEHDNDVPRPIVRAAGFASVALDAPMLKVDGE